ncbi:uncharacterized protein LOC141633589 isoform X2 [Silene latifolia]|uniref:uncharacterized protein LOC141633589 isoform X2 n=1 Tax=Silene latifolia TaxID=37657 RepID=UPI003D76DA08
MSSLPCFWCILKQTCVLEFDGASKGNPRPACAGAVLRTLNGNVICKIRPGLGTATNNAVDYQDFILGLKRALEMGYTGIRPKGDNKLVCMQAQINIDLFSNCPAKP